MRNVFTDITENLHEELFKDLPDGNIGEKIKKVRFRANVTRIGFAKSIHTELTSVFLWETNNIMPEAQSIKKISDIYNIPLDYFHNYYYIYYNNPVEVFLKWKKRNGYTYTAIAKMIKSNRTTLHSFVNGTYKLSYNLYNQLKELGVF